MKFDVPLCLLMTQSGHCKLLADIQGREERQDF